MPTVPGITLTATLTNDSMPSLSVTLPRKIYVCFLLLLLIGTAAYAQSPGVTLGGTVKDISGNVVPAAKVTATLGNYGANAPIVIGNSTLAPIEVSTTANGSGVWSLT